MTRARDILSSINESINWVDNSTADLQQEYNVEYQYHVRHWAGDIWPTFEDFEDAYRAGQTISLSNTSGISGATMMPVEDLLDMVKGYRSWPQYRNDKTFQDIIDGIHNGSPMKLPIVLEKNGRRTIMSGNTRLNLALVLTGSGKAKVVQI
jgi:hypothetical protein